LGILGMLLALTELCEFWECSWSSGVPGTILTRVCPYFPDEPDPDLSGAVPAAAQRTQLGPSPEEEHLEFPWALPAMDEDEEEPLSFPRALFGPDVPAVAVAVSWDCPGLQESTLERLPCPGDSRDSSPFPLEPRLIRLEAEHAEAAPEQRRPHKEPKQQQPEGLGAAGTPEKRRRGPQRLEWISRAPGSPAFQDLSPAFQEPPQAPDVAAASSFPGKAKAAESCRRKVPEAAEPLCWAPPRPDAPATQSWTVNAEDSVERLLPAAPCGSYVCGEEEEEDDDDNNPSVFTCIECSIYFRRREHLLEHMLQHNRGAERGADDADCGWALGDPASLERHRRLHRESRHRILQEIQKLNEFPDEGREARLQCPKCVFGTNSSKVFVQHAKMHVKERKESASRGSSSSSSGAPQEVPGKAPGRACALCGFPAPTEHVLREHLRYAHSSHFSWQHEAFQEDPERPGTSRDSYGNEFFPKAEEFFPKSERLFPAPPRDGSSHLEPATPAFPLAQPRCDKSHGATKRDPQGSRHARKGVTHPSLGFSGFSSPQSCSLLRKRAGAALDGDPEEPQQHQQWPSEEEDEDEGEEDAEPGDTTTVTIPQAALELKRTFRTTLKSTDPAVTSEEQQHQLRMTVPLVLLQDVNPRPKTTRKPRLKPLKRKKKQHQHHQHHHQQQHQEHLSTNDNFLLEDPLPLDVLLLELEELLGSENSSLKSEERRCPYCPDRFHNGIGLANHVRGHLNRVGVSYNVRHFISAEEVKAIEQSCSFQKKKKKVANFDPGTFSLMRCEFCGAGFDTRAGLSSHARAHLRDFGITNWELTVSPIHILKELLATAPGHPALLRALLPPPAHRDPHREMGTPLGLPLAWAGDEGLQPYRDVLAPEEEELVAMEVTAPPGLPKKPGGSSGLEPPPPRLGPKVSPEPPGGKAEPQDAKAPSLTTCEVCGACFETRKGLSSHARSHLRQLGVAESESSGAPIDLLYELVRHKPKAEGSGPSLHPKKPSPKEAPAPRALLPLHKAEGSLNKAIKSPPGFSKSLPAPAAAAAAAPGAAPGAAAAPPGSPGVKKVPPAALPGSPGAKSAEDGKGGKLALSPLPAEHKWGPEEDGPLNLTSGSEPCRDIRCEFCGEFFENRKGLSSHARSHLRQMGVTEWYVNGSPIDTLREILTRRRSGGHPKALAKSLLASLAPLEPRPPPELHIPGLGKKAPLSPPGSAAASPPPPTARKVFPGLSAPSLHRKLKQDQLRVEIKRELMAAGGGGGGGAAAPPDPAWAAHEEMAPLNLSSRADPVRDIRCEFCGEFFENRKGLSSHARSHLRQMGVTEWSVNGSPIDTLREILRKKSKPCLIKKEPPVPPGLEPAPKALGDEGLEPKSPGKGLPPGLALAPLGGRPGKGGPGLALSPLGAKNHPGPFLPAKRPLGDDRLALHGEAKHKAFELGFKAKALHDKASAEACCELCGLYFENRKALASHARAHLRQFGVTEWCVNGSPIETLREWIRHRPHKAGAYRSYIQGGRPFSKKFRGSGGPREHREQRREPPGPFPGTGNGLGDGKGTDGADRALGTALAGVVKVEEQRGNFSKFERRQARPLEAGLGAEFPRKAQEPRVPPARVRPVPALVPRPPQTSLVRFVGSVYTLKCR
ncbi:hypothetical protein HGM15179_018512, partial [Zosterops borbonicus]